MSLGGEPTLGIRSGTATPPRWVVYFAVQDRAASLVRARDLGGVVVRESFESPVGPAAELTDPEGTPFGIVEARHLRAP